MAVFERYSCATAVGAGLLLSLSLPAVGQGVSTWCSKFDQTSEDQRLKTMVIQVKSSDGTVDADLAAKFKFANTLQAILTKANSKQKPEALVTTMVDSFRTVDGDERQPKSHLRMKVSARPGEAQLRPADLVADQGDDSIVPVGFFNRFDLSNFPAGHCGEARIVFAKKPQAGRRLLIIFEGKVTPKELKNENEQLTESDCRPVAEFWASLIDKSAQQRADALQKFYFDGDMGTFGRLPIPPMSFENLGGSNRGQVRANLFINGPANPWQLREWLLRKHGDRLAFDVVTVKDNPLTEFYDTTKASTLPEPNRGAAELADFQDRFKKEMLKSLVSNNAVGSGDAVRALSTEIQMAHGFGFGQGLTAEFDEFESTSQGDADIPKPDSGFQNGIDQAKKPLGSDLTIQQVINRATALTCHGCHQPEGVTRPAGFRLEIAPNVFWPKTLNFVHIDEDSKLSEALSRSFIPFRAALLKDHLCRDLEGAPAGQPVTAELFALRKAAPAPLALGTSSLQSLRQELATAASPSQRAAIQEIINDEQIVRRRAERSLPGSLWPYRRTH